MRYNKKSQATMLAVLFTPSLISAQDSAPASDGQSGWMDVLSVLLVLLAVAIALFVWFMRQRSKQDPPRRDD